VRYGLISGIYGKPLNFTDQGVRDAQANVERYRKADALAANATLEGPDSLGAALDDLYDQALDALCDNLNTPVALAKGLEGAKLILKEGDGLTKASAESAKRFLDGINGLLGIVRSEYGEEEPCAQVTEPAISAEEIEAKIAERAEAKKAKDFGRADAIRQELDALGVELRDTPTGTEWVLKGF
jgi:cysteinyl-tRNA synthetase